MDEGRERAAALVRGRVGRHEEHAIEPAGIGSGTGDSQMAGVDRIEAAAEVADVHVDFSPQIHADECGLMIRPKWLVASFQKGKTEIPRLRAPFRARDARGQSRSARDDKFGARSMQA